MTSTTAVVTGPRSVSLQRRALPPPSPTQLRVRLQGCGVCGSNLPVWQGRPWFKYPLAPGAPGHEAWGIVESVGGEVKDMKPGDRVAMLSYHAFAEFDTSEAGQAVRLPRALDDQPFPGEALGCAMNVFRRSGIREGQLVAVVGVGFLGALLVNLAARHGARVIAVCRRPGAGDVALQMGAKHVIVTHEFRHAGNEVMEVTSGRGCERVIEAAGQQEPLTLAGDICGERARLIIAGYHQDGPRVINLQSWNWRGLDVINAHERDPAIYLQGMRAAVDAVARGRLDPAPLYTHRFKLDQVAQALDALHERPPDFLKGLLLYE